MADSVDIIGQSMRRKNRYFGGLMWSIFLLALGVVSSAYFWHYTKEQQLTRLKQTAERRLDLYGSKIKEEFGQIHLLLLPVLGNNSVVQSYIGDPRVENRQQAQDYLNNIINTIPNRAVFLGSGKELVLASHSSQMDRAMLNKVLQTIATRAFQAKGSKMFLFSEDRLMPKFLMVAPISGNNDIRGFIGILLDFSDFQEKLAKSWTAPDEILVVSDQRGIIMLSSDPSWLYRTFSNLPYRVKKSLGVSLEQQKLFTQIGPANTDEGILTLNDLGIHSTNNSYLVHSVSLSAQQLRLHHLTNISPIEKNSATYIALAWASYILAALLVLFFKEKKASLKLEVDQQKQLRVHEAELKQHHKMVAMGMMATTMAHEINQPITSIKTEAIIGKKHLQQGNIAETSQSLANIISYTRLLAKITSQLKIFARKNKFRSSAVANVYATIQSSHLLYQHRLESEKIHWCEFIDDRELNVQIDEYQLQQILGNLIQNACDAMKTCIEKKLVVQVSTENEYLYIDISDTGEGVSTELQQSIFEPFVSTKNEPSSMGLGLAICKDILNQVHGNIELLKSSQGGSFRIILLRHCFTSKKET